MTMKKLKKPLKGCKRTVRRDARAFTADQLATLFDLPMSCLLRFTALVIVAGETYKLGPVVTVERDRHRFMCLAFTTTTARRACFVEDLLIYDHRGVFVAASLQSSHLAAGDTLKASYELTYQ
ncbi:MAG: hypothetical protein ACYDH4_12045 [Candidatus Cryosericum sp.]